MENSNLTRAQKAKAATDIIRNVPLPKPVYDSKKVEDEIDSRETFTINFFYEHCYYDISEKHITKVLNNLIDEKDFLIHSIFTNKNISRDLILKFLMKSPTDSGIPVLSSCLAGPNHALKDDEEIIKECIRIEGADALSSLLKYKKDDLDFIYKFIEETSKSPRLTTLDWYATRNLYKYHFNNKKLIDLVCSYYKFNIISFEVVIDFYTWKKITDTTHLMEMFEKYKEANVRFRGNVYKNIVERILILEDEIGIELPELIEYFSPKDKNAYVQLALRRPDIIPKVHDFPNYRIFCTSKKNLSEEYLEKVMKRVDKMYPRPLPFKIIFKMTRKKIDIKEIVKLNPMSFLRRYIFDIDEILKNAESDADSDAEVGIDFGKVCKLCREEFEPTKIPHKFGEHHVECDYIYSSLYW